MIPASSARRGASSAGRASGHPAIIETAESEILAFGVRPEFRSGTFVRATGIRLSRALFDHAAERLVGLGHHTVQANVEADNLPDAPVLSIPRWALRRDARGPRAAARDRRPGRLDTSMIPGTAPGGRIADVLAGAAAERPDAVGVIGDRTCTWRELDDEVTAIARGLAASGIAPGDRVAVFLDKTTDCVAALYGAWRAGAVMVPVNETLRARQVEHIVRDSGASVVISSERKIRMLGDEFSIDAPVRTIEELAASAGELAVRRPRWPRAGSDPVHLGFDRSSQGHPHHPRQPAGRDADRGGVPRVAGGRPDPVRPAVQLRLRTEPAPDGRRACGPRSCSSAPAFRPRSVGRWSGSGSRCWRASRRSGSSCCRTSRRWRAWTCRRGAS